MDERLELVFKALADPTRRALLDALFDQDGQGLSALVARFEMTRPAVAKHLGILADASLVVVQRRGRETLFFLNSVPIREVHDRWVDKYTQQWAAGLVGLRTELEQTMEKVFEIYIRTTPERLWEAIVDPTIRAKYNFGAYIVSDWTPGSPTTMVVDQGPEGFNGTLADGEILEIDPPWRLVQTMRALWGADVEAEGTSRVTWAIEQVQDSCRLVVTHDQLREGANDQLYGGWPMILSGLKTWLETGDELTTPGSILYAAPQ